VAAEAILPVAAAAEVLARKKPAPEKNLRAEARKAVPPVAAAAEALARKKPARARKKPARAESILHE
jgi:hypothetical protein